MRDKYPACRFQSLHQSQARVSSFPSGNLSMLRDVSSLPSFNLADKAILHKVNIARDIVKKQLAKHPNRKRAPAVVRYDSDFLNEKIVKKTLNTGANAERDSNAEKWRSKTKHRTVTSQVALYADGFGNIFKNGPVPVIVTTGCAPNLMGTSTEDEKTFLKGNQLKNPSEFKKAFKKLFLELLSAQDESGVNVCVLPFIGGDLYMNKIGMRDKPLARQYALEALREVLQDYQFKNIKEVVFAAPDKLEPHQKTQNFIFELAENVFKDYRGKITFTVSNVDMLNTCEQLHKLGKVVGMINAGSDRTLGGAYKKTENFIFRSDKMYAKSPAEELLFNLSDAAFSQAIDMGAKIVYQTYRLNYAKLDAVNDTPARAQEKQEETKSDDNYIFTVIKSKTSKKTDKIEDVFEMEGIYTNIRVQGLFALIGGQFVNMLSFQRNKNDMTYTLEFASRKDTERCAKHLKTTNQNDLIIQKRKSLTISSDLFEQVMSEFEKPKHIFNSINEEMFKDQLIANYKNKLNKNTEDDVFAKPEIVAVPEVKVRPTEKLASTHKTEQKKSIPSSFLKTEQKPAVQHAVQNIPKHKHFNPVKANVDYVQISKSGLKYFVQIVIKDKKHFDDFKNNYLNKFNIDNRVIGDGVISLTLNNYKKICGKREITFDNFVSYKKGVSFEEIFNKINARITTLKKEKNTTGCMSFFKNVELKQYKIKALKELKTNLKHKPGISLSKHIEDIRTLYPNIDAGFFSRETKKLLNEIQSLDTVKFPQTSAKLGK